MVFCLADEIYFLVYESNKKEQKLELEEDLNFFQHKILTNHQKNESINNLKKTTEISLKNHIIYANTKN